MERNLHSFESLQSFYGPSEFYCDPLVNWDTDRDSKVDIQLLLFWWLIEHSPKGQHLLWPLTVTFINMHGPLKTFIGPISQPKKLHGVKLVIGGKNLDFKHKLLHM